MRHLPSEIKAHQQNCLSLKSSSKQNCLAAEAFTSRKSVSLEPQVMAEPSSLLAKFLGSGGVGRVIPSCQRVLPPPGLSRRTGFESHTPQLSKTQKMMKHQ